MFNKIAVPKDKVLTPKQQEALNEIASVVKKKLALPTDVSYWDLINCEILRVSRNELDKLAAEPSWEKLMQMKFFDEEGNYIQPLLLIHPDKKLCGFVIDIRGFVELWFYYMWFYYDLQGANSQRGVARIDVEPLTELEALALEAKNSAIIEQVDAILAKAKVETM